MYTFMYSKNNMNDMVVIEINRLFKKLIIFYLMNILSMGSTKSITTDIEYDV